MAKARAFVTLAIFMATYGLASAAEPPFYQGKTITIVEGRAPGGVGSMRVSIAAKYLQKHLTGNPAVVYQYMSGGGGTAAANHLANMARRDGLTLANVGTGVYSNAIFGAPGVRYKLEDFVFLGSASSGGPYALIIRPGLGLDTVDKLRAYKGLRFANRTVGHTMYILDRMMAYVLEFKEPKWILGYNDDEIIFAVARGEADARSHLVHAIVKERSHWFEGKYAIPLVMKNTQGRGAEANPGFPQDRPTLDRFVDTEMKRAVLRLHDGSRPGSSVFFAPQGMPEAALRALKEAFNKVWNDPQFPEEYQRLTGEPPDPITGEEIEQVLRQIPKDPKVIEVYKQIIGAGPLPPGR
jgi:tripartite-type tricarboxylate transporter receptor subunit TctC